MTVKILIEIEEITDCSEPKMYQAITKVDYLEENNIKGLGYTPEEALDSWLENLKEQEFFRPD